MNECGFVFYQPCDLLFFFFTYGYVDIDFHFAACTSPHRDPGEKKQKTYGFYRVEPYAVNHGHEQVLKWPFLLTFFLYQPADRGRSHIV